MNHSARFCIEFFKFFFRGFNPRKFAFILLARAPILYCILQRMKSLAFIDNPLVVYIDNDEDYDYVRSIRQNIDQNRTCIVQLERSRMWAFSSFNKQRVQNITSSEGYPRIYPSTVVADYSLMRNAKYEVSASE